MSIIWAVLIGFVVGIIAKFLTPGKDPSGFFITAGIGIGGSLAATFLGRSLGWYATGETAGLLGALVGSIILLLLYRMVKR
ncbi:MAG: GlsB/YeaQ/YmgE family stress response membrane protein [Rhodoferax sp.]|uniref:GlsB/YeaQ/YmgE family stress response membrane protein n=1 Tax=Rhodoferax sp. TaxID=50421 RepID=UPI0013FE568B|nr:GlsB/YeaQ/YmgE family stress response membrane protein [Rhodoferax sp.]NDP40716.1 GlsB/YeaQ/YmgE family stress response membrane protein [Rhodoferax sp.]